MRKLTATTIILLFCLNCLYAQNSYRSSRIGSTDVRMGTADNPQLHAMRIGDEVSINLDGIIDEQVWEAAPLATGFTQRFPDDGGSPSQQTEARILYTDTHIYVGIMAYDTAPDSATSPLFRRDGSESSDWVYVSFDSYNDRRTAFTFAVNPRGVQKDVLYYDDTGEDILWDAVWEAEANIGKEGWSVEMKIPLSQLRFSSKDEVQTWGVNFQRRIARNNEIDYWAPTSQKESGAVSKFGRLNGIRDLKEPRRLEVIPYVSSTLTRLPDQNTSNPYYSRNDLSANIGGDIKYGLTSDLTLTATINPDFGQVEADPATINLSAFETFFSERRPFFLEGNEIFRFGRTDTYNTFGNPNTFYSRRIGRAPQGSLSAYNEYRGGEVYDDNAADNVYRDVPRQTNIAAAAKLSGKTKSGWSIGILDAFTPKETGSFTAEFNSPSENISGTYPVEPATNYLVTRVKKDINEGNTVAGGFVSAVNRSIDGTYFENQLRSSAYLAGADFEHNWKDREYVVSGTFSVSQINGTSDVITAAQRAPQRYMQRVDSEELSVDSDKTSLGGFATELSFKKASGDHFTGSVTYSEVSPGYETNDIGFQNRADYRALTFAFQYQETDPKNVQFYELWSYHLHGWNYDGDRLFQNYNLGGFVRFKNQWYYNMNFNGSVGRVSDRLTRGGPLMKYNSDLNMNFNFGSDRSKKFSFGTGQFHRRDIENEYDDYYWFDISYRPTTFIQLTFAPELGFELDEDQYITTVERNASDPDADQTYGYRYVFSDLRSMNLSATIRLNWTFSPEMSLQTYVRPFISSGEFSNFGEFNDPGGFGFDRYGEDEGSITLNENNVYEVDRDLDGEPEFTFGKPDYTFRSLQGNAVFRWEYMPGSTLFLVWQQQRSGSMQDGNYHFGRELRDIFDPKPTNVFLVKLSYWFGS